MEIQWHSYSLEDIKRELRIDFERGLTREEVKIRLTRFGANELPRGKRLRWWHFLLRQFKNPLVFILLVAALLTFLIQHYIDTIVILIAVVVNVGIGFFQEFRSNKIFEKLQQVVRATARVVRDGKIFEVDARELVPGDVILLRAGYKVPADARLLSAHGFETNEALLTGESTPVHKKVTDIRESVALADRINSIYAGTAIERGEGTAVVVNTGARTEIGKIALLTSGIQEKPTPLQERLARLGKVLSVVVLFSAALIVGIGALQGRSVIEMFVVAVAVAVAAIPEGLPAALSVVLAVSSQRIFKVKGLVKNLIGAETLGSTTVICTDKTGTLTEGRMKVEQLLEASNDKEVALALGLANEAIVIEGEKGQEIRGDSTEVAHLEFFLSRGEDLHATLKQLPRKALLPFDPDKKYIASFHQKDDGAVEVFVAGAPEMLLALSTKTTKEQLKIQETIEERALQGFRMIGVAKRLIMDESIDYEDNEQLYSYITQLEFLGLAALRDPIRKDVKGSLKEVRGAGIRVIMVTGDHRLTASAIGQELGFRNLDHSVIEGKDLDVLPDEEFAKRIDELEIFARVSPKHKIRIVEALKKKGAVVAMTGDGINDAPALKAADIGVALEAGTDVTKEAADLVLLDNGFSIITAAVKQGRIAFDNIRKVVIFLLANSFTELIIILSSLVLKVPLPITAVQILWANLVEDGLPNFALAFEPGEDVMKRKPFKRKEPILDKEGMILVFVVGLTTDFVLVGTFLLLYFLSGLPIEYIRTFIFAMLATDSLMYVFSIKSLRESVFHTRIFNNKYLLFAVGVGFLILALSVYAEPLKHLLGTVALRPVHLVFVLMLGIFKITGIELTKWWFRKKEIF